MNKLITIFVVGILLSSCATVGYSFIDKPYAVSVGMTRSEVIDEWGQPWDVNVTRSQYGDREQWVYQVPGSYTYETAYVYFEDGRVTTIQN